MLNELKLINYRTMFVGDIMNPFTNLAKPVAQLNIRISHDFSPN
jgi:hypothetical protein